MSRDNARAGSTVGIQGFGAVGAHAARLLEKAGLSIAVVSNECGVLRALGTEKLDIEEVFDFRDRYGDGGLKKFWQKHSRSVEFDDDPNQLFERPLEMFIPAARTSVLATEKEIRTVRKENKMVRSVEKFWAATGVSCVAEGANAPLTPAAEHWLESKGVLILPDFIVNCGGLIGCYVEWVYRAEIIESEQARRQLISATRKYVRDVVRRNTDQLLDSQCRAREAAEQLARNRATELRELLNRLDVCYPGPADARRMLELAGFDAPFS